MDTNKLLSENLRQKIQHELEELSVDILSDLISHLYIKSVDIINNFTNYTVSINCIDLEKENMDEIKKVICGYNSNYIKVQIAPTTSHIFKPEFFANGLVIEINIDLQMYKKLIIGNQWEKNLD